MEQQSGRSLPSADSGRPALLPRGRRAAAYAGAAGALPSGAARGVPGGIWLVTARHLAGATPLEDVVGAAVRAGVAGVQLREKELPARELYELATRLGSLVRAARRARGAAAGEPVLVVNDRLDVALAAGADGVHLGGASLPVAAARRVAPRGFLVGASVHDLAELERAAGEGADYVVFGTVFPTASKPGCRAQGLERLREACAVAGVPVLAIGGMGAARLAEVRAAGAHGACVLSAIMGAADPAAAAAALVAAWRGGVAGAVPGRGRAGEAGVTVFVNGVEREVPSGLTVGGLLDFLGLRREGVAVERNLEIVRRGDWDLVPVREGDRFEVVQAVGGG